MVVIKLFCLAPGTPERRFRNTRNWNNFESFTFPIRNIDWSGLRIHSGQPANLQLQYGDVTVSFSHPLHLCQETLGETMPTVQFSSRLWYVGKIQS